MVHCRAVRRDRQRADEPSGVQEPRRLRLRLTPAQAAAVRAATGVALEDLDYPDPGGELAARLTASEPGLHPDDIARLATAQALVLAYTRDRAARLAALDASEAAADAEAERARDEMDRAAREARQGPVATGTAAPRGSRRNRKADPGPDGAGADDAGADDAG